MNIDILFHAGLSETEKQRIEAENERLSSRTLTNGIDEIPEKTRELINMAAISVRDFMEGHGFYIPVGFWDTLHLEAYSEDCPMYQYSDGTTETGSERSGAYDPFSDSIVVSQKFAEELPRIFVWKVAHELFHRFQKKFSEHYTVADGTSRTNLRIGFLSRRENEDNKGYFLTLYDAINEYGIEVATYLALRSSKAIEYYNNSYPDRGLDDRAHHGVPARIGKVIERDVAEARGIDIDAARLQIAEAALNGDRRIVRDIATLDKYMSYDITRLLQFACVPDGNTDQNRFTRLAISFFEASNDTERRTRYDGILEFLRAP